VVAFMRRLFLLFLPASIVAVLAGCPPAAPDLGDPPADCATRPPPLVSLLPNEVDGGPGPADAGLLITEGIQGGDHIWLNVKVRHLGPTVLIEPTVRDAKTGELLSQVDLSEVDDLADFGVANPVEPDGGWPVVQVQGRLEASPDSVIGRAVTLSATVTDACPRSARASRTGLVTGYDPSF
jgi:hypothetical protein